MRSKSIASIILVVMIALTLAACGAADNSATIGIAGAGTTSTSTSVDPSTTTTACANSWVRVDSDKAGNRWFANGVPSIASASTPEEAKAAAHDWLAGVRTDPVLFVGAVKYTLHVDVNPDELFDDQGCATAKAVDLNAQMETALALASIKPDEAPTNGYNSGTSGDQVVGATGPGVSGDRKAILVELPDGTKIWIMARCGNPVTLGPPPVPPGIPPETPPTTPPGTPTCPNGQPLPPSGLCPKDPSRDPQSQGNVPTQATKDHPSPDNSTVVAQPPTPPVDSPTGCPGPCPPTPSPTPTTPPVTPPPTSAPPPAPPTTESPTVPITSP